MNTLNRYITNQHAYIAEKKKQPLLGFTAPSGKQATWEDIAVTFTSNKGISINLLFNNDNQPHANINSTFSDKDRLDEHTHHLLFAFALDVLKENNSNNSKRGKVTAARKFLIALNENIASSSLDEIQNTIDEMKYIQNLSAFFEWLNAHKMLPASMTPNLTKAVNSIRAKSGNDAI